MFGIHLVSLAVGAVIGQLLPLSFGVWVKGKLFPAVKKLEAAAVADVKKVV